MKELTIEEKAKAYNKVREKIAIRFGSNVADEIFSEYEESEDEKIRKEIMDFIDTKTIDSDERRNRWFSYLEKHKPVSFTSLEDTKIKMSLIQYISELNQDVVHLHPGIETCNEWIAWLEKQGEQKPVIFKAKDWYVSKVDGKIHNMMYNPADKKEQKEIDNYCREHCKGFQETGKCFFDDKCEAYKTYKQKFAEKVEPKFHEGEWVVYECGDETATLQITRIAGETYVFSDDSTLGVVDEDTLRLWDITKDAKDGDVLATDSWLYMFKYTNNKNLIQFHCNFPINEKSYKWCILPNDSYLDIYIDANIHPATKEQRDLLFQKMKEAGYVWNSEKKELKKMESTEHESEEELSDFEAALFSAFSDGWQQYLNGKEIDFAQWAKEHSAELLEAANQNHIAWSEEDETNLRRVEFACMKFFGGDTSLIGWLRKTLKRRLSS